MGDSITYNWGQPWASTDFTLHPHWKDVGVIGITSGAMVDMFQAQVIARHPQMVAILAGTNDVYPGWTLCGDGGEIDTCHNIDWMVRQAQANEIQPILATIPPWGCPQPNCALAQTADNSPDRYVRIDALNGWIKAYAEQQGLVVVDYHSVLVASDGKTYIPDLTIDGVHPMPAGYDLMTPMIQDAIAANKRK